MAAQTKDKSFQTLVSELWQLTVAYAKQETLGPLKGIQKFLLWGVIGSFLVGLGVVLLSIGILRLVQQEAGLAPHFSWVPYAAVAGFAIICMALLVRAIGADRRRVAKERQALEDGRP